MYRAALLVLAGAVAIPLWRWLRWRFRRRTALVPDAPGYAVYHVVGGVRRLYHASDDARTAKAHYNANNAPAGAVVEFFHDGKPRGRRVQP